MEATGDIVQEVAASNAALLPAGLYLKSEDSVPLLPAKVSITASVVSLVCKIVVSKWYELEAFSEPFLRVPLGCEGLSLCGFSVSVGKDKFSSTVVDAADLEQPSSLGERFAHLYSDDYVSVAFFPIHEASTVSCSFSYLCFMDPSAPVVQTLDAQWFKLSLPEQMFKPLPSEPSAVSLCFSISSSEAVPCIEASSPFDSQVCSESEEGTSHPEASEKVEEEDKQFCTAPLQRRLPCES